jgi:hypothetical protein
MTLQKRLIGVTALAAAAAALALPAGAAAAGPRAAGALTFAQSFPVASRLCANVAAGTEKSKKIRAQATAVAADCMTLETAFAAAELTVNTARTTDQAAIAADRALIKAACPKLTPAPKTESTSCKTARTNENAAIKALQASLLASVHSYYKAVESIRHTFWTEIKALRGLSTIQGDKKFKILSI